MSFLISGPMRATNGLSQTFPSIGLDSGFFPTLFISTAADKLSKDAFQITSLTGTVVSPSDTANYLIFVSGTLQTTDCTTSGAYATIFNKNGVDLSLTGQGLAKLEHSQVEPGEFSSCISMIFYDTHSSIGIGENVTYTVAARNSDSATNVFWNPGNMDTCMIIIPVPA